MKKSRKGKPVVNCPKCHAEITDDSRFCSRCGASLKGEAGPAGETRTIPGPPAGLERGHRVAGKYKILEEIGRGGMGVVYKAEDTRLDRTVALKFLPQELTRDEEARARFIQEAKAAAALEHPNICTVYEVDEAEGRIFISMAFIQGQSLKDKLRGGPLDIEEAKAIALQVAEGLREAHEKGIVHRDIKPANIMVTDKGQAKIMDFGLAKLSWGADLTKPAMILGTAAYMSPEQAKGEPVDRRTDIWSFGATLYEMLTGERPFRKGQERALIYAVLNEDPEPMREARPEIPRALERIVLKALEKDPAKRYPNNDEMLEDLEKADRSSAPAAPKSRKSLIVLPFENISPDPDQDYFCDGMTEEIISDLSNLKALRVISRTSAMMLKGTKKSIMTIGRELDVQYVLEGSVRRAGKNLRIAAQLIDAGTDAHLWARKFSGTLDDVFDIQEKVSQAIVNALELKLSFEEKKKIAERPIDNAVAYDFYLRAYGEIIQFSKDPLDRAIGLLHQAIEITGENAVIFAGIAFTHFQYANLGIEQDKNFRKTEEFIAKALGLDPDLAEAHFVRGCMEMSFRGNTREAIVHFQRANSLRPNDPKIMTWLSFVYDLVGKMDDAVSLLERSIEIDPMNPVNLAMRGINHLFEGRFDLALNPALKMLAVPGSHLWTFWASLILLYNGRPDEARDFIDERVKDPGQDMLGKLCLILKHAVEDDKERMASLLTPDFVEIARKDCQYSWHLASFYSYLGDIDESLGWLENAVDRGFVNYPFLSEHDRLLASVRGEPRFKTLMERVRREWESFEV
ncbi:MAG TPA: zinc-ribbon domain-containing protein [Candidatus Aminicenantes bacterium]|nr:zinc-ribbon domain-containing protein [Candidatus Aminicenantes bacterium]